MALARLALKNLQQKTATYYAGKNVTAYASTNNVIGERLLGGVQLHGWNHGLQQRRSSSATSDGKEVAIQSDEGSRKRSNISSKWKSLLPRSFRRPISLWKRKGSNRDTHPLDINAEIFPPASLGNALFQAAENMNRLFENMLPTQLTSPSQLMGKFKETDESYKLRFDVPGLTKEDVKVTIDDGVLRIRGERKVEEEDESDDEYYMSYGYYNTSLVLPEDCKQDEIKAELKDGVLSITIPKAESHGKDVKEIQVN